MKFEQIGFIENDVYYAYNDKNPMVNLFGIKKNKKCKTCVYLFCKKFSKNYYKCALRKNTNGPATDHRVNWNACNKYSEEKTFLK